MKVPIRVLLIEDDPGDAALIQETLAAAGVGDDPPFTVTHVDRLQAARPHLEHADVDVVLSDLDLPDSGPAETVAALRDRAPAVPMVGLTRHEDATAAQAIIRAGAQDCLPKDEIASGTLPRALRYAIARGRAEPASQREESQRLLPLFNRVGRTLGSTLNLDAVLESLLEEVRTLLGVVASSVWLVDPDTKTVTCRHATGPQSEQVRGWQLASGEGIVGWVIQTGQSLIVSDTQADARHFGGVDDETGLQLRSILTVPLEAKATIIGALQVLDAEVDRFDAQDLALLEALAASAAIAVENARLYHEAQQEIADRRRAEQRLQRSEERYRLHFENVSDVIYSIDTAMRIADISPSVERLLGYKPASLVGRPLQDVRILAPESLERGMRDVRRVLSGEKTAATYRFVTQGGKIRWGEINATPTVRDDGTVTLIGVARDITERKRAEAEREAAIKALRESEAQFDLFMRHLPAAIAIKNTDQVVVYANERYAAAAGCQVEDLIGTTTADLLPEDLHARYQRENRRVLNGETLTSESSTPGPEGTTYWITYKFPIYRQGEPAFVGSVSLDITERKRAEQALQANERQLARYAADLERSNQELEQFGYVVSHDLRAPLRTVKNYLRLLRDRYADALDAKGNEYVDYAIRGAERMKAMIQALLDLSRIETGGCALTPTNVEAVVDDTLQTLASTIVETGAVVTYDPLPTVKADASQLIQVFQNLIANALKFRREGVPPRVRISARFSPPTNSPPAGMEHPLEREHKGGSADGGKWVFSVTDNGIGLDPDQADVLFQIFQRLHTEEEYEGLGIGLALCRRIIDCHGGHIWVESTPGEGATFFFTLPAA